MGNREPPSGTVTVTVLVPFVLQKLLLAPLYFWQFSLLTHSFWSYSMLAYKWLSFASFSPVYVSLTTCPTGAKNPHHVDTIMNILFFADVLGRLSSRSAGDMRESLAYLAKCEYTAPSVSPLFGLLEGMWLWGVWSRAWSPFCYLFTL